MKSDLGSNNICLSATNLTAMKSDLGSNNICLSATNLTAMKSDLGSNNICLSATNLTAMKSDLGSILDCFVPDDNGAKKFVFSTDVILCGWLSSKHQLTSFLPLENNVHCFHCPILSPSPFLPFSISLSLSPPCLLLFFFFCNWCDFWQFLHLRCGLSLNICGLVLLGIPGECWRNNPPSRKVLGGGGDCYSVCWGPSEEWMTLTDWTEIVTFSGRFWSLNWCGLSSLCQS